MVDTMFAYVTRAHEHCVGHERKGWIMTSRDEVLTSLGVDPDVFKAYMKQSQVDNECGTDEYGETQPMKGVAMISEEMQQHEEFSKEALDLARLLGRWLQAWEEEGETRYAGAEALVPALEAVFDYRWERGYYSIYQGSVDYLDDLPQEVDYYREDMEVGLG
jgi:hypothetical protein